MRIFLQMMKVDEARREVHGRATQEVIDKSREIFDYETSKPHFKSWSEKCFADTGGKSLGNIRAMHGKVCAGKVSAIDFNDAEKAIDIVAKIVNDNEWEMVKEGCYTGFSIGGSYEKRWADEKNPGVTRFTANPIEISLVDSPCVPTAKFFDVLKQDGSTMQKSFKKYEGQEIGDASAAMEALRGIFYLICTESNETEDEKVQVQLLREAAQRLKEFIASEIMGDNSEVVETAMAMFAHGMPMDEVRKNIKKVSNVTGQHGTKPGLTQSAPAVQKETAMDAEALNKAAERLEKIAERFEQAPAPEVQKSENEALKARIEALEKAIEVLKALPLPQPGDSVLSEKSKAKDNAALDAQKAAAPSNLNEAQDLVFGARQ